MARKICNDCIYHENIGGGGEEMFKHLCHHPDNMDLVTGQEVAQNCYTMRQRDQGLCGIAANLFVLKTAQQR